MSTYFQWFFTPLFSLAHTCSHFPHPFPFQPPVHADTNFEYDTEFFSNSSTPNKNLHHPSPYTNTKNVNHKVTYLLTTLIQNENRKRINIYLKISYGNRKNNICFKKPIYCFVWRHQPTLLTLINVGTRFNSNSIYRNITF